MYLHRSYAWIFGITSIALLSLFIILTWSLVSSGVIHNTFVVLDQTNAFIFRAPPDSIITAMRVLSFLADPSFILLIQSGVLLILIFYHRDLLGSIFIAGMLGGEASALLFKDLVARPRPQPVMKSISELSYAYPSAHALMALVFYGFLAFVLIHGSKKKSTKRIIAWIAAVIILLVGVSRLVLGVHWLSDVIGGWLLGGGILSALLAIIYGIHAWYKERHKYRHSLYGIAGLSFVVLSFLVAFYTALNISV